MFQGNEPPIALASRRVCSAMHFCCILHHMNIRRPTDLHRRRDRQDARKKYIIVGAGVIFLSLLGGALFAVKRSDFFAVRAIETFGVPADYGDQVRRDLEDFSRMHSLAFRFLGANNMLAWSDDLGEFLDANPQFKMVRVQKDHVRRTIKITIGGREKFGVWCGVTRRDAVQPPAEDGAVITVDDEAVGIESMDACYWFDRDGMIFAKAPQVQSELFNRVYDSTGRTLALRDAILPDRLFVNLVEIFTLLEVAEINTKTVFISDLALEEVYADSVSDPTLYFSLHASPGFALSAINAIKKEGHWDALSYIDLRSENRAYYK